MMNHAWVRSRGCWVLLPTLALLSIGGFLLLSQSLEGPGYPLDDAWIHQTYARNVVRSGSWSFQAGQVSAGSTSPAWTALLIPGYWLGVSPVVWSSLLGVLLLVVVADTGRRWLRRQARLVPSWALLAAALFPLEWHLVWAALSGMESLAAGALAMVFAQLLNGRARSPLLLGALAGFGIWLRPDMLTVVAVGAWLWLFERARKKSAWNWALRYGLGVVLLVTPYLLWQWSLSGSPWPSTYYAKQAEYASLLRAPLLARYLAQWRAPLAGPLAVLLPGLGLWSWHRLRARQWGRLGPLLWAILYPGLFALRLPATYQHGRYAMPAIPVLMALCLEGMSETLVRLRDPRWRWVLPRAWIASLALAAGIFSGLGARAYALDVAIIESEMVRTANWIAENTEPEALIAAHDIGALGYFGNRQILDLAGLVSPEVIPILRDEQALETLLAREGADYLMTFPAWYPRLVADREPVFAPDAPYSPAAGGGHMSVYRW